MALRFDSATEYLERTSVAVPYTVCGWSRMVVDRNNYSTLAAADVSPVGTPANSSFSLQTDTDGVTLALYSGTGGFVGSRTLTVDQWFFWAIANATGGTSFVWYHANNGDSALYSASGTYQTNINNFRLHVGNNAYSELFNGRMSGVRVWGAQLTENELLREMQSLRPQRTADLYLWTPMVSTTLADNSIDISGSARNWTVGGTLSVEDGPPVSWGSNPIWIGKSTVTAQYARPTSDVSAGGWTASTGSDLFAMLDEETASDTDYVLTTAPTTCQIVLSAVTDPATSSGQVLLYRAQSSTEATLIVRLKQGATTVASATHTNVPATWTEYTLTLTAGECDSITDYTDLRIELEAT